MTDIIFFLTLEIAHQNERISVLDCNDFSVH